MKWHAGRGDAAETLAGLRAALAPGGEIVLESTPNGAYGCFYDEWVRSAVEANGVTRHFLPWWLEAAYESEEATDFSADEMQLMSRYGLNGRQDWISTRPRGELPRPAVAGVCRRCRDLLQGHR